MERLLLSFILLLWITTFLGADSVRHPKLLRSRTMLRRVSVGREGFRSKRCFDVVGCFTDRPPHLNLKRAPEHPSVVQTRFLLYTRENREEPDILEYGDDFNSIVHSRFDPTKPLRVLIHGYKGSGSDAGTIAFTRLALDAGDCNVLIIDWTRGAATSYSAAVANTELIGRQLALVLLDAIHLGMDPRKIHVVGFSLGAHIAGCASEVLKKKNLLLGRITGLDPASPFFRNHLLREKSKKLDATDAHLVDVIHTDGSEDFADGFGLLKPVGHIDFFPNGGKQQPGCSDVKNSVVVSQLKDALDRDLACSHIRAVALFVESIGSQNSSCKFNAWPCPQGSASYLKGLCFPMETAQWTQEMGMDSYKGPLGIYYLPTRGSHPFCGEPFRASVTTADAAPKTKGTLYIRIPHKNSTTDFRIQCSLSKRKNDGSVFYNIAAVEHKSIDVSVTRITAFVWYQRMQDAEESIKERATSQSQSNALLIDKLALEDRRSNRWEFCNQKTPISGEQMEIQFLKGRC